MIDRPADDASCLINVLLNFWIHASFNMNMIVDSDDKAFRCHQGSFNGSSSRKLINHLREAHNEGLSTIYSSSLCFSHLPSLIYRHSKRKWRSSQSVVNQLPISRYYPPMFAFSRSFPLSIEDCDTTRTTISPFVHTFESSSLLHPVLEPRHDHTQTWSATFSGSTERWRLGWSDCDCDSLPQWKIVSCDARNGSNTRSYITSTERSKNHSYSIRGHLFNYDETRRSRYRPIVPSPIVKNCAKNISMSALSLHLQSKTTMKCSIDRITTVSDVEFSWLCAPRSSETQHGPC